MTSLVDLPAGYDASRDALQHVTVHVIARAAVQAGGRIDLRPTAGGWGTPELDGGVRVRLSGGHLIRETADDDHATFDAVPVDGSTLDELAALARVDLDADLYVGKDTPPRGATDRAVHVDPAAAAGLAAWFAASAAALDAVAAELPGSATPTAVRLWPEHFDVAIDAEAAPGQRLNLGGAPGDGFHELPYAYVGPWTDARPGDDGFWNAPFGAVLGYEDLAGEPDPAGAIAGFFRSGLARFGG